MAKKGNFKNSKAVAAERRINALELRKEGASYRVIGSSLNISEAQAFRDVRFELNRLSARASEEAEALRTLELERLDRLWYIAFSSALSGNLEAIDRALAIMARRARLLGLDKPTVTTVNLIPKTDPKEMTDDELAVIAAGG